MIDAFSHPDTGVFLLNPDLKLQATSVDRLCNGCTKCCDGWLSGNIYGFDMYENKPCRFSLKNSGCAIYTNRPYSPCKTFKCYWKTSLNVPEKFKPSKSDVIMILRKFKEFEFLDVIRAGPNPDPACIEYTAKLYENKKVKSVRYLLSDNTVKYLSEDQEFIDLMNKQGKFAESE